MQEKLNSLKEKALTEIQSISDSQTLESLRIKYLGKKGELTKVTKELGRLPQDQRQKIGQLVNKIKSEIEAAIPGKDINLLLKESIKIEERVDISVPGRKPAIGHLHPVTQAIFEIEDIFGRLGFVRRHHREVETDYYVFEALNMPKDHPARDDFETFYITDDIILTSQTSSGQVRAMEEGKLPIRALMIGKCYRPQIDASHTPMFFQFEGLLLDKDVSIAELKGTLDFFAENYFGKGSKMRLRPYDFRFTEPSFEVDVTCTNCNGVGCRFCKEGWLELGGAGMVHPKVIENGGLDPKKVNGFAFGWGVERVAAIKHKIPDIRMLYQNDLRFLEQF